MAFNKLSFSKVFRQVVKMVDLDKDFFKKLYLKMTSKFGKKKVKQIDKTKSLKIAQVLSKFKNLTLKTPYANETMKCYIPVFEVGEGEDTKTYYLVKAKGKTVNDEYYGVYTKEQDAQNLVKQLQESNNLECIIEKITGKFTQPGDADSLFRKRKKTFNLRFIRKYMENLSDEEKKTLYLSMSRPLIFKTSFPNSFYPTPMSNYISQFLNREKEQIIKLVRGNAFQLIKDIEYVDTYINKDTSPGLRMVDGGEILPSSVFSVNIYVDGDLEKSFHDYTKLKKYYVTEGTKTLRKYLDRDYSKEPILEDDFKNLTSTIIIYGSRGNNLDEVFSDFTTKDRIVMYCDHYDVYEFTFNQKLYQDFLTQDLGIETEPDQKTATRFRLIGALNGAYNGKFYPLCRALMHKFESGPRHFINCNEDLRKDFQQFVDKYKPGYIGNIDQSQCDRIMSMFIDIVMACLPDVNLIQTAAKNWVVYLGNGVYDTLCAMFSGAAWTTVCNTFFSFVKWAMLLTMFQDGNLNFPTFAKFYCLVFKFYLSQIDSIKFKDHKSNEEVNMYLFLCTDNMDFSSTHMTEHMIKVLELFKKDFNLNYRYGDVGNSFGCDIHKDGRIEPSESNQAEKIWFTENPIGIGHALFRFSCREEMFKGIIDLLCQVDAEIYGNLTPAQYKALYLFRRGAYLAALKAEGVKVSSLLNSFSMYANYEYKVAISEGIEDDILDVSSMNEFLAKDSKVDEDTVRENIQIFKDEFFRNGKNREECLNLANKYNSAA